MSYNIDVFSRQMPVIRDFLYHYVSYKELHSLSSKASTYKSFVDYTINAHYLQSINHWCMVFGSDTSNPTHWKHIGLSNDDRNEIINKANMDQTAWKEYWRKVTKFRNSYSAHRDLDYLEPVPYLDKAYDLALVYDEWIRDFISPDILDDPLLIDLISEYRVVTKEFIKKIEKEL